MLSWKEAKYIHGTKIHFTLTMRDDFINKQNNSARNRFHFVRADPKKITLTGYYSIEILF